MKDGEKTYSMSQIAGVVGLHPNTVRKYEDSMRPLIERDMTETKKALIK